LTIRNLSLLIFCNTQIEKKNKQTEFVIEPDIK
jgi:hypothetical protein